MAMSAESQRLSTCITNNAEAIRLEVLAFLEVNAVEIKDYETFEAFKDKGVDRNA